MAKKKKYTDAYRNARVKELLAGESKAAMSRRTGIHVNVLYAWLKKYGKDAMTDGKKDIKKQLKSEKSDEGRVKDAIGYLGHAVREMRAKNVEARYKALVELALFTLKGE